MLTASIICAIATLLFMVYFMYFSEIGRIGVKITNEVFGKWHAPFAFVITALLYVWFIQMQWYWLTILFTILSFISLGFNLFVWFKIKAPETLKSLANEIAPK